MLRERDVDHFCGAKLSHDNEQMPPASARDTIDPATTFEAAPIFWPAPWRVRALTPLGLRTLARVGHGDVDGISNLLGCCCECLVDPRRKYS